MRDGFFRVFSKFRERISLMLKLVFVPEGECSCNLTDYKSVLVDTPSEEKSFIWWRRIIYVVHALFTYDHSNLNMQFV
jgi:hypothetical protein